MSTKNTIKQPVVAVRKVIFDLQHPVVTTTCACVLIVTLGGAIEACIEAARYGKTVSTTTKKSNKSSRK